MSVGEQRILEGTWRDVLAVDQVVNGLLVQVPFFSPVVQTVQGASVTLFAFDALGATMRRIWVSFYLAADGATFTPTWHRTRPADLVTFTQEAIPAMATIVAPANARWYSYDLGELAQGLQGEFRLAQSAAGAANVAVDAVAVALVEL